MRTLQSKQFGGILLISGTAIGVGMLAGPIASGPSGIVAALCSLFAIFSFTLAALFVFLEALYFFDDTSINLIGLCRKLAGSISESIAWTLFLSLLYVVSAAYISAIGGLIAQSNTALNPYSTICGVTFTLISACISILGMKWLDRANRVLTFSLFTIFIIISAKSSSQTTLANLAGGNPSLFIQSIPVIITAFTYQIILPSIRKYLDNNLIIIKRTILIGCLIPLIMYVIWHLVIFGLLPYEGTHSLATILDSNSDQLAAMVTAINYHHNLSNFGSLIALFSFFAISTSFWGVMISLTDFISDGLELSTRKNGKAYALLLSYCPPILLTLFAGNNFVGFVKYAGIIILVLYGLLPTLLVWRGRYVYQYTSQYEFPGKKVGLLCIATLSLLLLITSLIYS
ncbi:hypothetical protein MMH89_04035 [Candidatus Comchoanobacter bicostacola]|uniref:Tyrosine-specific transport protein n=1 Tax=Candidatus Comchoanobacter bicostacola TaxID=2919598 RepID=A0ABY5DKQ9_9GAMM|nr:aromatic amino acid transport family protein [Candidatus Comchoanobacter bicostacola]UTC24387.1 hypothetical protein MMH89_04035 [Candidatus Comchoanobacter bicostacola]